MVGIVDSEDLPLNISRETFQNNDILMRIRKNITKRIIVALTNLSDQEKYYIFWNNFGEILKEGLCENQDEEQKNILKICKFYSTLNREKLIDLDNYLLNMQKKQKNIYYLNGDNMNMLYNSPQIEGFKKRNIPVILLKDHVDNFWVNIVKEYKNIKFKSITNEKIDLDEIEKIEKIINKGEELKKENNNLVYFVKEVLGKKVKDVVLSSKLIKSPACISNKEGRMSLRMERVLMNHNQNHSQISKVFEINPEHQIFKKIKGDLENKKNEDMNKKLVDSIFNLSLLIEGESLENPSEFAHTINEILNKKIN
jgi:molecular chaperone HtpG